MLLVLWSVVLYGGTAALCLWLAHRTIGPVRLPAALLLAAAPLTFTGQATLTGGIYAPIDIEYHWEPFASRSVEMGIKGIRTPLLSDVVYSMIPWQKAVRTAVKNGRLPLWNPSVLAGEPLLAVQQPAVLHPGTWIGFLLPLAHAWTFQMGLRLFLALLCAYLFMRDLGCRELPALIGAMAWAFSDFLVFWLGYPVNSAIGPFPLLLLGLGRLVRDGDGRAVAVTVVSLLLMITAGHPETLLFGVSGAGVYFLFQLAWGRAGRPARAVRLSLAAGALALGLSAVVLLPLAEALPQTWEHTFRSGWWAHVKKSATAGDSVYRAVPIFLPHANGESGRSRLLPEWRPPGPYAGALLFPLAVTGLLSRHRARWALAALGVLGGALWIHLAGVTDFVTALPLFEIGWTDYLVFLSVFALAALSALGADRLWEGEGASTFLLATVGTGLVIAALHVRYAPRLRLLGMPSEFLRERLWLELAPLCLGAAAVLAMRAWPRLARLGIPALAAVLLAARVAEAGRVYPTLPSAAFYPPLTLLDAIPRGAPDRIVGVGTTLMPNAAALYELEDVRGYESMTFKPLYETFPLWCKPQPVWFNRVDDLDKPFLSFLNVRYAIAPSGYPVPAGWRILSRDRGADLLENLGVLPRAFVPSSIHYEADEGKQVEALKKISDFADQGVLGVNAPPSAGKWVKNGRARVRIVTYLPQSMVLALDAQDDAVVATSLVAWRGWKSRLDGVAVEPVSYNHAFLAFRIPKGQHRLELRYLPDGFVVGSILSLLTLGVVVVMSLRPRPANSEDP